MIHLSFKHQSFVKSAILFLYNITFVLHNSTSLLLISLTRVLFLPLVEAFSGH